MTQKQTARPSDRFIPWYFVAFFAVVAIVDGIFVYIATTTHTGVVTEQAYEKGLAYDSIKETLAAQEALGWNLEITRQDGQLHVAAKDQHGKPLEQGSISADISRPTTEGHDFSITLEETVPGVYRGELDFPMPGQWDVWVNVEWNQQHYQRRKRVVAK